MSQRRVAFFSESSPAVPTAIPEVAALKPLLAACGYRGSRLKQDYVFGTATVPLVGFATKPWDFDSACIAVAATNGDSKATARSCRDIGAPIVWVPHHGIVEWWVQHSAEPVLFASKPLAEFRAFVGEHKAQLSPLSVYRGKTIARIDKSRQLDFVDAGLLPLLREQAGEKLHRLVEEMICAILRELGCGEPTKEELRRVFTAVFRLLAAKILKDKAVPGFTSLDLSEPSGALAAVNKHYGAGVTPHAPFRGKWRRSLEAAASLLAGAGSFSTVSPETLAYVYEHTLVTKSLRKKLGIHATPPSLVDYIVWRLYDWIREIPEEHRHVFEPACGHAPFLLSAMRVLRLEKSGDGEDEVHEYLKSHVHGLEIDDFAREIARLSLTLADVPNPNGWDLRGGDMFASDALKMAAARCRILLSNPPYEEFGAGAKQDYAKAGVSITADTKSTEMLLRTLPHLPPEAVFGVVVPQGLLHDAESKAVRERLLADFEIAEISVFADNLFEHGDHETAVLIGRRQAREADGAAVRFRRVREQGMRAFKEHFAFSSEHAVRRRRFVDGSADLRVRDLDAVWSYLADFPPLSSFATVRQGASLHTGRQALVEKRSANKRPASAVPAIVARYKGVGIWQLPRETWLYKDRRDVLHWRGGTFAGTPQVLINYASQARQPWRLKAFYDQAGHAVNNKYTTVRPLQSQPSALALWGLMNSPIANAFAHCASLKRHTFDGLLKSMPVPRVTAERWQGVEAAANSYLMLLSSDNFMRPIPDARGIRGSLLALDAEVLKLYDLPPRLERELLDLFTGVERKGVGCDFRGYYPAGFTSYLPLHLVIAERFQQAAADVTADRFKPSESDYVREVLAAAAATRTDGE